MLRYFSQAAQAIRYPVGIDPLAGLQVKRIIAAGGSQSQSRLVIYHNSIHPLSEAFDGYFLYLGLGGKIRTDLDVKVFKLDTETDVLGSEAAARQPDSDVLRTWEVAGTSHVGYQYLMRRLELLKRDGLTQPNISVCTYQPALSRIPISYVMDAVYEHLVRWIVDGTPPPAAPRLEVISMDPVTIARDEFGNALGGIQLSQHAVPTALNNGVNAGPGLCRLYGTYSPFDEATLHSLYRNHGNYVSQVSIVTNENLRAGYILVEAAQETKTDAAQSDIP